MTVKEFAEQKVSLLTAAGYKNVKVIDLLPCELSQATWSYEPFSRKRISETAEVRDRPAVIAGRIPGVMIQLVFVKPRCRKESCDSFRAALA